MFPISMPQRVASGVNFAWWLVFFLALRLGHPWTLFFAFVSLMLAVGLWSHFVVIAPSAASATSAPAAPPALLPLAHRPVVALGRQVMLQTLLFGMSMIAHSWVLGQMVTRADSAAAPQALAMQRMTAGALALGVCGVLLLIMLALSALLVVQLDYWSVADSPGHPPLSPARRWRHALGRALAILLGLSEGAIILDRGKLYRPDRQDVELPACVGPLYLDAREGQVAIIETGGIVTNAVNGRVWLGGNQRVTGTADLTVQTAQVVVEGAPTRDGVIIDSFEFSVRYQVGMGKPPAAGSPVPAPPATSGQFGYKPALVQASHWKDTSETYKDGVKTVARNVARSVISSNDLRDIVILPGGKRSAVENRLLTGIQNTMNAAGDWLNIKTVAIGKITLPDAVHAELNRRWVIETQGATSMIQAQADKDTMILKSQGQAQAFRELENVKDSVRQSLINQMSTLITAHPNDADRYVAAVQSLIGYMAQDSAHALQLVESLETMAQHSRQFNLYVSSNDLLQQGGVAALPDGGTPANSKRP